MEHQTESQLLFARSLKIAPGGVHSPVRAFKSVGGNPIFFKSGAGAHLHSVDGKSYIDYCQSFGPLLLGHKDPDVLKAAADALQDGWSYGACEPYSLALAEWITHRIPWVEKLRFVCSGTEAVMSAIRVARAATRRSSILKFEGCYHGHVDSLLVKAGSGLAGESASDSAGIDESLAKHTLVAQLDDESSVTEIFRSHGHEIAAVIIEPLPANYGLLIQRKKFIAHVVNEAKKHGSLVIFDEVISGFRVALGGMAEILNITPDLVTYGKVIGGGFPVGAYGGRKDLLDLVAPSGPVYQAGTLSANAVGMRAGLAALKKIEALHIHSSLAAKNESFCTELTELFLSRRAPFEVKRFASLFWIHPTTNGEPIRSLKSLPHDLNSKFAPLFHRLLEQGIYLPPSGYEVGFLSNAHGDSIITKTLQAFDIALR